MGYVNRVIKEAVQEQVKKITATFETYDDWNKGIMQVAAEICGVSKGGQKQKTAWWWIVRAKESIKEKRFLYEKW